jgi:hypothetical protein
LTGGSGSAEDDLQLLRTRGAAQAAQGKERNTKVQARARCSGRLLAILLTGGESDGPVAERLIAIGKASQRPIGDRPEPAPSAAVDNRPVAALLWRV